MEVMPEFCTAGFLMWVSRENRPRSEPDMTSLPSYVGGNQSNIFSKQNRKKEKSGKHFWDSRAIYQRPKNQKIEKRRNVNCKERKNGLERTKKKRRTEWNENWDEISASF
jgi:hypothetical protein